MNDFSKLFDRYEAYLNDAPTDDVRAALRKIPLWAFGFIY